jgi:hypothetical protein
MERCTSAACIGGETTSNCTKNSCIRSGSGNIDGNGNISGKSDPVQPAKEGTGVQEDVDLNDPAVLVSNARIHVLQVPVASSESCEKIHYSDAMTNHLVDQTLRTVLGIFRHYAALLSTLQAQQQQQQQQQHHRSEYTSRWSTAVFLPIPSSNGTSIHAAGESAAVLLQRTSIATAVFATLSAAGAECIGNIAFSVGCSGFKPHLREVTYGLLVVLFFYLCF